MTRFEWQTSRERQRWQWLLVALMLVLIWLAAMPTAIAIVATLLIGVLAWQIERSLATSQTTVCALMHGENGWQLLNRDQSTLAIEWRDGSVATPYFLALSWQAIASTQRGHLLIWRDALSEADYRHLCRLYWQDRS